MNRRHFITTMGGVTAAAASLTHLNSALAATGSATPFYAKGLIMASFEDPTVLRLGLPKAPGHKATLSLLPQTGGQRVLSLKGAYAVETAQTAGKRDYKVPELIRMQEIYGNNIHSRIKECPTVISIPYAAIQSITAAEVSPTRYTFVREDNGQEIMSFRPRQVAETLKIDLSSDASLKAGGKVVALNSLKEVHIEYAPEDLAAVAGTDAFTAHFPHYNAYMKLPENAHFNVLPKNLGPMPKAAPQVGNNFVEPFWPYLACFVVAI